MWEIVFEIFFYLVIFVLLFGGLFLVIINLPGAWVIWLAILLTALVKGFAIIPLWFVIVTFLIAVVISILDNFIIAAAARKYGGGKWGMLGGVFGAFLGFMILNLPGLFIGPFLGAFAMEYLIAKKNREESIKAGVGSLFGVVLSIAFKAFFCLAMVISFLLIWIF